VVKVDHAVSRAKLHRQRTLIEHYEEISVLKRLGIFRGEGMTNARLVIAMSYFPGIPLDRFLRRRKCALDSDGALSLLDQLDDEFFKMYGVHIVHGDLHWNNVLVQYESDKGSCKVLAVNFIDYGFSKIVHHKSELVLVKRNTCRYITMVFNTIRVIESQGIQLPQVSTSFYNIWYKKENCENNKHVRG
jgi:RIO-like serine/threonine protein kinase